FINLSSDFAVNFVLEYEKVDYLLISNRINNLNNIIIKAQKKKIKIFILGKDIEYPLNSVKVRDILLKEINKTLNSIKKSDSAKKFFKSLLIFKQRDYGKHVGGVSNKNNNKKIVKQNTKKIFNKLSDISNPKKDLKEINNVNSIKESIKTDEIPKYIPKNSVSDRKNYSNILDGAKKSQNIDKGNTSFNTADIKSVDYSLNKNSEFIIKRKFKNKEYQIKTIRQKVIAVTKAKGGVGGTIISIFLGLLFRELKTLLIDLNFSEGGSDICYYLDIPKAPNLAVFTEGYDKDAFCNSILNIVDNLDVIQSPSTYIQSKKIDLKDIYSLTDIARKKYDLIIFDLPNYINEFYLGIIDLTDLLVMVSDCTAGSIGRLLNINNKYVCNELERILIINKYNKFNSLKVGIDILKDYFNISSIATLKEVDVLNSKSDFKLFDFNNFDDFKNLSNMVTEILTR
ncbi:hypothetical protein LLG07_03095, partial [bacterium]|nr:hypothetical protein [bacterium]